MSPRRPTHRRFVAFASVLALAGLAAACTNPGATTAPSPSDQMMEESPMASDEMMEESPMASDEMMEEPSAQPAP